MLKFLKVTLAASLFAPAGFAGTYNLGREATTAEISAWDIDVRPDGLGLPDGSGGVLTGEEVFIEKCASCHGDFGEGAGRWPVLSGGQGSLEDERPVKTIGSYWPYLSTVWDYINRAMPFGAAQTLTNDEVYAITAYLLYVNDVVDDEEFVLSRENFLDVSLPNEANFLMDDRADAGGELDTFTREPCMANCAETAAAITKRAAILDVTPEDKVAREARQTGQDASGAEVSPPNSALEATAIAASEMSTKAAPPDAELIARGEKVFKKCKSCHQIGEGAKNKTGPHLNDVVGRAFGAVEGFRYSKPMMEMAAEGAAWDADNLAAFLSQPKAFMPRTRMSFSGLKKEKDVVAVVEYLRSLTQ